MILSWQRPASDAVPAMHCVEPQCERRQFLRVGSPQEKSATAFTGKARALGMAFDPTVAMQRSPEQLATFESHRRCHAELEPNGSST